MTRSSWIMAYIGWGILANTAAAQTTAIASSPTMYLQASSGDSPDQGFVVGATLPLKGWSTSWGPVSFQVHMDAWMGAWKNRQKREPSFHMAVLGFGPMVRLRGNQGSSPWFVEAGVGAMYSHKNFYHGRTQQATRWNFTPQAAIGVNFGAAKQHEVSLRFFHASNASLKEPNPGIEFVQLRYAHTF